MAKKLLTGRANNPALPDPAARETDRMIEEITKRLRKEYGQAAKETQAKLDDYLRRFKIKDEKWQEWVLSGEKTEAEYKAWRESQIMVGKRWEDMKNQLAQEMHRRNITAREYVNGQMPKAYAENHNYAMYEVESGARVDLSYTLYDEDTVKRILVEQPELLPPPGKMMQRKLKINPDIRWQKGQIQSLTLQSILQGESIPNMAKRISRTLGERNMKSAVRYARTAMTGAQNAGREDGYERAVKLGIDMEIEWMAVHDGRTRHEHRLLDDQRKKVGGVYVVPGTSDTIRFPGDPTAPGYLIWNCRCTTRAVIAGWQSMSKQGQVIKTGQTYAEWKADHGVSQDILTQKNKGDAIRQSYVNQYRGGDNNHSNILQSPRSRLDNGGATSDTISDVEQALSKLPPEERRAWENIIEITTYQRGEDTVYDPDTGIVYLIRNENAIGVFHEMGHKIDAWSIDAVDENGIPIQGASQFIDALLRQSKNKVSDSVTLAKKIGVILNENGDGPSIDPFDYRKPFEAWADDFIAKNGKESFDPISDIIDSITAGDWNLATKRYAWHGKEYWRKPTIDGFGSRSSAEAWANYCSLRATKSEAALSVLENIAPNLFSALKEAYMEVFGV